jgi:hypothetical protein
VKIQGETQLLHRPVIDVRGRRLGRVLWVNCAPDSYTAAWLVLRVPGWPRRLRAVPADRAQWSGGHALQVPYARHQVLASPPLEADPCGGHYVLGLAEAFYVSAHASDGAGS